MRDELPILYVKTGCPWCVEASEFLKRVGVSYRERNVNKDRAAWEEMERISGQNKAPVLDWKGEVLADFGVAELKPFLWDRDVRMEDS